MSTATETRHLHAVELADPGYAESGLADPAAEQVVLGMMMGLPRIVDDVVDILQAGHFNSPKHGRIFGAITGLWASGEPTDAVAVARALDESGDLKRIGGGPYLHTLLARATTSGTAGYHAGIVLDWAQRRQLYEAGLRIVQVSQSLQTPTSEVIDDAQRAVHEATVERTSGSLAAFSEFGDDELAHLERIIAGEIPRGLSSGLAALDDLLGGFLPGQLIIPAGRPGSGKSTLGLQFAVAAARAGHPAIVFTLEMSRRELTWRLLSSVAGINLSAFTSGHLNSDQMAKARAASQMIAKWPLHIDDRTNTVAGIRTETRRFRQRHGALGLVYADYLQRFVPTRKFDRKDLEVGTHAKELKTLGQELEVPMIVPSQLNRGSESRTDKIPQLSDMRDSGEVEQEADVVILIHRPDYYDAESPRAGEADLIVAKNRNGPKETVTVASKLHVAQFADMGMFP
ncbi:replicative DNA helicase [Catenuloplanes japonicus]|uniref:replicative DNA helicase n=1 Tax=Catenuloplanes japonicus TaxID=33876 RepID=UPI00068AC589|nr:replicative DNA helicase [Catenuloplanes japonicus]